MTALLYCLIAYVGSFFFLRWVEDDPKEARLIGWLLIFSPLCFPVWLVILALGFGAEGVNFLMTQRKITDPGVLLGRWVLGLPVRSPAAPLSPSGPPAPPEGESK